MVEYVITAVGQDRPGLVDEITKVLSSHGVNIADTRMVNLHGQFASVMLIQANKSQAAALRDALPDAGAKIGMTFHIVKAVKEPNAPAGPAGYIPYRIRTYAIDQTGIVNRIAHMLHGRGVNIEELNTVLGQAPHTGAPLFTMDMVVSVPPEVPIRQLRDELEDLCETMNCDLQIDRA